MDQTCSAISAVKATDESKDEAKATPTASSNTKKQPQKHPFGGKLKWPETKYIGFFLDDKSLGHLSMVSHANHKVLNPLLISRKLLAHTVKGEESLAKAMLEANPELLLINNATTKDYSGKSIHGLTAFQAALCAGDADMVKMMQPYFDKLDDGSQKMAEQIHAVFPEGYDTHLHAQAEATFNFDSIFNAVASASDADVDAALSLSDASFEQTNEARNKPDNDLTLVETLNRFRESFSQQSLSETIYNPQHLLKALELYNTTFEDGNRGNWNWDKRDLFWRQIIGFCQRFIPACTAQAFAQSLYYLVKVPEYQPESWEEEHFNRSLKFRYGWGSLYPIMSSCSGLGFNYAVGSVHGSVWTGTVHVRPLFSKNLFQSSQQVFAQLYQEASPRHGMHALNSAR